MNTQPNRYEVYNGLGKGQEEKEEMLLSRTEYLMPAPLGFLSQALANLCSLAE